MLAKDSVTVLWKFKVKGHRIVETKIYNSGILSYTIGYDHRNRITKTMTYRKDGTIVSLYVLHIYSDAWNDQKSEQIEYWPNGKKASHSICDRGKWLETKYWNQEGAEITEKEFYVIWK